MDKPADNESLAEFAERVTPSLSDKDRLQLQRFIEHAQSDPPEDKEAFATKVNAVLRIFGLAIQLSNGEIARLQVRSHGPGRCFFVFRTTRRSCGFKTLKFRLIRMEE